MRSAVLAHVIVSAFLLAVVFALSFHVPQYKDRAFLFVNVEAMGPFNDTEVVLGWIECWRADDTVLEACSASRQVYPLQYPKTWLQLSFTGLGVKDTKWVGVTLELVFFLSLLPLVWNQSVTKVWPLFVLLLSPPVWLALERGNMDLLVFAIVSAVPFVPEVAGLFLLMIGVLLKFYPIGAIAALANETKRSLLTMGAAILMLIGFVLSPMSNISGVIRYSLLGPDGSFGWRVLPMLLNRLLVDRGVRIGPFLTRGFFALMWVVFLCALAVWWRGRRLQQMELNTRQSRWVRMGIGIYLCSFMMGYTYDYRYIFLLPVVVALLPVIDKKGWLCCEGYFVMATMLVFVFGGGKTSALVAVSQEVIGWVQLALSVPLWLSCLPGWMTRLRAT